MNHVLDYVYSGFSIFIGLLCGELLAAKLNRRFFPKPAPIEVKVQLDAGMSAEDVEVAVRKALEFDTRFDSQKPLAR